MSEPLIRVKDLSISVQDQGTQKMILENVNFSVHSQRTLGIVGGSGSGKTTIGLSIMNLLPNAMKIRSGEIFYKERDVLSLNLEDMRAIRGKQITMVFQEPLYAFNPIFTIGSQIDEVLKYHTKIDQKNRINKILEVLRFVGISDPQRIAQSYPHQLSGGLRQRAMVAQAIAADPDIVIADEPTSNLDVTLQAKIIELFQDLKKNLGLTLILISHDLGMVECIADEVVVMHQGRIVEFGLAQNVCKNPQSDYARRLWQATRL